MDFLDIDRFKAINDTFGYVEGDKVLKESVALFKSAFREIDNIYRNGRRRISIDIPG